MNKFVKRWMVLALCVLAGQAAVVRGVRANADTGLLGAKLASAEKTHDLFTFFHLVRTGSEALAEHRTLVTFKPSGEKFRPLVTLAVTTDESGAIERLRLEVARSFIDDARQGIFAADLVKSFLASAGNPPAKDDLSALAEEIHARALLRPGQTVLTTEPTPAVSEKPSAGYQVFAGKTTSQTVANRAGTVQASLQNKDEAGAATLGITLSSVSR